MAIFATVRATGKAGAEFCDSMNSSEVTDMVACKLIFSEYRKVAKGHSQLRFYLQLVRLATEPLYMHNEKSGTPLLFLGSA